MAGDDEEEDYMSMIIPEPSQKVESSVQRAARKKKEGLIKGQVKSKKEKAEEEAAARMAALNTALDSSNKGFKMMSKLGYKPGQTLGKSENARMEPITLSIKDDRGGIGMDTEKKRKIHEAMEGEAKRVKPSEIDYRERVRLERDEKRHEAQFYGAQKVAEKLDTEKDEEDSSAISKTDEPRKPVLADAESHRPLKSINILWRGLARHRLEKEKERRMRHDLYQSLSKLPTYEDPDEDEDDKQALGKTAKSALYEEEIEEEDPELDDFDALPMVERLDKVVSYLRQNHHYCFWCKFQYPDIDMEGCPGVTEEDHD